jgi:hypothetical protein
VKYKYIRDEHQQSFLMPQKQTIKVTNEEGTLSILFRPWLGGCGTHFVEEFSYWFFGINFRFDPKEVLKCALLVEDILEEFATLGEYAITGYLTHKIRDVYFTLALPKGVFEIGESFGKYTKLINVHENKAHGPYYIYTFHTNFPH